MATDLSQGKPFNPAIEPTTIHARTDVVITYESGDIVNLAIHDFPGSEKYFNADSTYFGGIRAWLLLYSIPELDSVFEDGWSNSLFLSQACGSYSSIRTCTGDRSSNHLIACFDRIKNMSHNATSFRIALVGNKTDKDGAQKVQEDDIAPVLEHVNQNNQLVGHFKTSAKKGTNVKETFLAMVRDLVLRSEGFELSGKVKIALSN